MFKLKTRYDFGRNWKQFSKSITKLNINQAERSLNELVGDVKGKTVLDIGCGSGIHALAFLNQGAKSVTCIDYDINSVITTSNLLSKFYKNKNQYSVEKGDILSPKLLNKSDIKKFDIVYSWGVLHHTGSMFKAVDNACEFVSDNGSLAIALYIKTSLCNAWKIEKKIYSSYNWIRPFIKFPFFVFLLLGYVIKKKMPPWKVLKEYKSQRGMSLFYDIDDWLGGFPYESVNNERIIDYLKKKKFFCQREINTHKRIGFFGSVCGQWLFKKNKT